MKILLQNRVEAIDLLPLHDTIAAIHSLNSVRVGIEQPLKSEEQLGLEFSFREIQALVSYFLNAKLIPLKGIYGSLKRFGCLLMEKYTTYSFSDRFASSSFRIRNYRSPAEHGFNRHKSEILLLREYERLGLLVELDFLLMTFLKNPLNI